MQAERQFADVGVSEGRQALHTLAPMQIIWHTTRTSILKCPHPTQNCCFILWMRKRWWRQEASTELVFLWREGGDVCIWLSSLQPAKLQPADSADWPRSSSQPSPRVRVSEQKAHIWRWRCLLYSDLPFQRLITFLPLSPIPPSSFFLIVVCLLACFSYLIWNKVNLLSGYFLLMSLGFQMDSIAVWQNRQHRA